MHFVSEIERIINEVDSSMSMEGLPLTNADKERISVCLNNPKMLDSMISELLKKHKVNA